MSKKKIFGILIVLILLFISVVHGVWASDGETAVIDSNSNTVTISAGKTLKDYNNLYAIKNNSETISGKYNVKAKAEIDGWDATFTNLENGKSKTIGNRFTNNVMAAIFIENDKNDAQKGLYKHYYNWCAKNSGTFNKDEGETYKDLGSGAKDYGFKAEVYQGNGGDDKVLTAAKSFAEDYTYHVTMYYLESGSNSLILVDDESENKTKDIFVMKEWEIETYEPNKRDITINLIKNTTVNDYIIDKTVMKTVTLKCDEYDKIYQDEFVKESKETRKI